MDALFMTVTTITTIGYGEIKPLTTAGRLFTIFLAFTGIGSLFYTLGVVMEYLVGVRLADPMGRRRMERRIGELTGHVIVAGMGRVGRQAALELHQAETRFVVVDPSEQAVAHATERGYLALQGDATEDAVLKRAGIARARGPDRHHGQRRHQRVRGPVRPGPRPRALHRRARRRRGRRRPSSAAPAPTGR